MTDLADMLAIGPLLDRPVRGLSGGEQQRVALARALAPKPSILLLDEPFAAVDPATRQVLRRELRELHEREGITTLQVTHDFDEALRLGDLVAVLSEGRIAQSGTPEQVFRYPNYRLRRPVRRDRQRDRGNRGADRSCQRTRAVPGPLHRRELELDVVAEREGPMHAVIRPEDIVLSLTLQAGSARNHIEGRVSRLERMGPVTMVHLDVGRPLIASLTSQSVDEMALRPGMSRWWHSRPPRSFWCKLHPCPPASFTSISTPSSSKSAASITPSSVSVELLVVGGRRDQRGVVQSASYGARRFGIHAGMPIAEAVRLCPQATFFQGAFAQYRTASLAVRRVLEEFSPTVVSASLDEAYLDFAGTERLYPVSLLPIAEQLRDRVKQETGLDCSVGIGPNRMIAKLASDYAKPRGLMEVRAGWEEGFLAGLPLRAMPGVGPKTAERWAELGLVDVHQVQMMDERALERLIGPDARALKLRARGQGGTVLRADRLPKSVSRETTLSHDMRDPEKLERILALLTARVAGQLRDEQILARTVTMKLRHDDFRTVTRRQTLETATDLDAELYRAARDLFRVAFEEVRRRNRGVRLIGIAATNLGTVAEPDLFEPPERDRLRQLTAAVDKVRGKFGFNSVTAATILELRQRRGKP